MGLDLGHHDLYTLLRLKGLLMLPHELKVQPDVIDHAVDHDGNGEVGDGLVEVIGVEVQRQRADNQLEHQHRQPCLPPRLRLKHANRHNDITDEQNRADIESRIGQRSPHEMVIVRNIKADIRKQRRQVDRRVHPHQRPRPPQALLRRDHPHEQHQHHRADGIAVDRCQRSRHRPRLTHHQPVFQMVLNHQTEHHGNDDPHGPLEVRANIGIDGHNDRQQAQQRQRGEQRQRFHIVADDENSQIVMMEHKGPHRKQYGRRHQRRHGRKSTAF